MRGTGEGGEGRRGASGAQAAGGREGQPAAAAAAAAAAAPGSSTAQPTARGCKAAQTRLLQVDEARKDVAPPPKSGPHLLLVGAVPGEADKGELGVAAQGGREGGRGRATGLNDSAGRRAGAPQPLRAQAVQVAPAAHAQPSPATPMPRLPQGHLRKSWRGGGMR